jgi:hypothetical protein
MKNRRIAALVVIEIKPAGEIAAVRPLDLDDPGAKIHQSEGAIGSGQELAHIHNQQAGQRQFPFHDHGYFRFPDIVPGRPRTSISIDATIDRTLRSPH